MTINDTSSGLAVTRQPAIPAWQPALRTEFPLLERAAYLQTGSLAPLATSVRNAVVDMMEDGGIRRLAGQEEFAAFIHRAELARGHLAHFLHGTPEHVGWVTNTSLAIRLVLNQIRWRPADVLVTSDSEHVGTRNAFSGLAERYGVEAVIVPCGDDDASFLAAFAQTLQRTGNCRFVFLSHVSCQDGRVLPVKEATRIARTHGVPVAIDGAQAAGQISVDVQDIDCDYYIGSGHKWLLSPPGLAYIYARDIEAFAPDVLLAPASALGAADDTVPMGRRTEIGIENWALRAGLDVGISLLDEIGLKEIGAYVGRLVQRLRDGLASMPQIETLSPAAHTTGIVALALPGRSAEGIRAVVDALWREDRVFVKFQPEHPAIRVSIAAFNTAEEVDWLLNGLDRQRR